MDLFDGKNKEEIKRTAPLADRLRPADFSAFVGQEDIVGEGKALREAVKRDEIPSIIFWGPPGSGKTTLANIIARETKSSFREISAVHAGLKDLREIVKEAEEKRKFYSQRTILFIDEIHRWNKAQQDSLLPYVEKGVITLIGATTENPSFEIISPLLSRSRVFVLQNLREDEIKQIISRALADERDGLGKIKAELAPVALKLLIVYANGDARRALNGLETSVSSAKPDNNGLRKISPELMEDVLQKKTLLYDRAGEEHYNIISALHKSMRGSDSDASLYWLARMLEAGEDPLYVARRVIRFASEDVGLADPGALLQAVAAYKACHYLGMPECNLALAQAVVYCAKAKKDNELYRAYGEIQRDVAETINDPVPIHLRNAPTKFMKDLNYGKDYKYNPKYGYKGDIQDYLPEKLKGKKYYRPKE